ncbi:hypothetical protein [Elioraea sp.]|uniref:hypothetical protein n=1 Tax=Elioraea sp. TaxID=2185103 RepID=UPI003F72915D
MIVPLAWSLDSSPLTGLLFLAGALLIGLGVALLWFRRRWAAVALALGAIPMGLPLAGQAPAIAGRPALRISATHIACTPWTRAIAWADVAEVLGEDIKQGRRWRDIGIVLVLKPGALAEGGPPVPDEGWWLWLARFSRNRIDEIGAAPEPSPGGRLYCQTLDVAYETEVLKRLARELVWATARSAESRAGLAWCETSGNLTWRCVANADTWHRACSARGGDYDACRRGGL